MANYCNILSSAVRRDMSHIFGVYRSEVIPLRLAPYLSFDILSFD